MSEFPFDAFAPVAALVGVVATAGWVYLERLKIKHGYPLEGSEGQILNSTKARDETVERLNSLTAENARLKSDLADLHARVQTLEKIATDPAQRLASEIERLG
jgi:hypothetical protein